MDNITKKMETLSLKNDDLTYVKESNIPNAGKGLFANRDFKKDEIIGEYKGKFIYGNDFVNNGYILQYKHGVFIDGNPGFPEHTNMSFINTLQRQTPSLKYNVKISIDYKNKRVNMKTIKPVKKDEEFYLNYHIPRSFENNFNQTTGIL